jgi:hypothetical protein
MKWFEDDSCIISDEVMAMTPQQVKAELAKFDEEFRKYKSSSEIVAIPKKQIKAKLSMYDKEFKEYKSAANL